MTTTTATTEADPFVHPALFYRGSRQYLQGTTPFVLGGLDAGEPVAVAVPERNLRLIRDELGELASQVRLIDMSEAGRNPGRIIPAVLTAFADLHPGRRVRIIGEPIWPERSATEYPACVQHEALINLAFAGRGVTILCPYDLDGLDPEVVRDARMTHPTIMDASGLRISEEYAPEHAVQEYNRPLPAPGNAVEFAFGETDLFKVRAFAVEHASRMGLSGERLQDLRLIASELASNSLDHGGGSGTLRLWFEDGRAVIEVSDAGHIVDLLAGRRPAAARQQGSRGLLMTNLLSDLVRIHTGGDGTTVRAYFTV
ncbi:sensor histidine kinase [Streptosporangium sandarakinum]|uniref:Anti-sigma regulatory factor (Ser/Thr protein kinase) n=1 Tax=Streptosporangium sandarakinum TaxID=1260955 RepID=A0A852V736_9ACTN|nr:sensor histidine kinase [Streptosporangium sandarakinum]NYF42964.1 anti-sigma regulatory factor (Ser/Thr protein kinase) [Streptosporangium sandarakinum]